MFWQLLSNAIVAASTYCILGVSFAVIFIPTRFFHFAHGAVFTAGAYATYTLTTLLQFPLLLSVCLSALFSMLLGCLMELLIYRPLRRKSATSLILLLASLGIYVVLQNTYSAVFGDTTRSIRRDIAHEGLIVFSARITPIQIASIAICACLVAATWAFLRWTRIGKAIRAVAADSELALICGINSDRAILSAFAIGSLVSGLAGILVALDLDMTPTMGMHALMMAVAVVIVGGVRNIMGVVFAAVLLGLGQQAVAWYVGSQWQESIALIVMVAFLWLRPSGLNANRA